MKNKKKNLSLKEAEKLCLGDYGGKSVFPHICQYRPDFWSCTYCKWKSECKELNEGDGGDEQT